MKNPLRSYPAIATVCLFASLLPSTAWAEAEEGLGDAHLLLARNRLVIKSRLTFGNEFAEMSNGGSHDKLVLGGVYSFGFNQRDHNFAIGFELPILNNRPTVGGDEWGVGDIKLRLGQLLTDTPGGWRAGWFFDTEFDTAANAVRAIANQRNQMSFGAGASHPLWGPLTLTSTLQYGWSLDEGTFTGRKSEWEAHLTTTAKISPTVSLNLDYKAVLNMVGGTEVFNTLEPSIGWTWSKELGVYASCELPLDSASTDWVAKAGIMWFF